MKFFILSYKFIYSECEEICYESFKTYFHKDDEDIKAINLINVEIYCLKRFDYNLNMQKI